MVEKLSILSPNPVQFIPPDRLTEEVGRALDNPVGAQPLQEIVKGKSKVAVCVSDRTRTFPKNEMIAAVLERISASIRKEDITFIIAGGNHTPQTPGEAGINEEIAGCCNWISHDSRDKNSVFAGKTSRRFGGFFGRYLLQESVRALRDFPSDLFKLLWYPLSGKPSRLRYHLGLHFWNRIGLVGKSTAATKVYVNRAVKEAELIITIGQVKPHYLAGYSGGAKSILPAVTSIGTTASNHCMRPHPKAALGIVKDNPIRADMENAARVVGNVFIFNCVLNGEGRPYRFYAGDTVLAHRQAARAALEVGGVEAEKADVVVVFARPPVSNSIYQFTKAIAPAIKVVKKNGVIIAVGDCPEGVGDRFIVNEMIFKLGFKPRIPRGVDLLLVSKMQDKEVLTTFFKPLHSLEEGLEFAARKLKRKLAVNLITEAGPLVPYHKSENPSEWI